MVENDRTGVFGLRNVSDFITEDWLFKALNYFSHFIKTQAAIVHDNHNTHITINKVLFGRANKIMILTYSPLCKQHLQPFTIFASFKARQRV